MPTKKRSRAKVEGAVQHTLRGIRRIISAGLAVGLTHQQSRTIYSRITEELDHMRYVLSRNATDEALFSFHAQDPPKDPPSADRRPS